MSRSCRSLLLGTLFIIGTMHYTESFPAVINKKNNAIIPEYSGGRLGDNLVAVANALYFALKNDCEMLLVPFPYSDQLTMDTILKHYSPSIETKFARKMYHLDPTVHITFKLPGSSEELANTLFILPFFPYLDGIEYAGCTFYSFYVNWQESTFKKALRTLIAPKKPLFLIKPPEGKLSVAVHVRKGGGFDTWSDHDRMSQPGVVYRSPLNEYFINQIKILTALFDNTPLYVFLFTDDANPKALAETFASAVNSPLVTFDYRTSTNNEKNNVLEDLFSMAQFNVLIRPHSNFSIMAEILGDHAIIISPGGFITDTFVQQGCISLKKSPEAIRNSINPQ